MGARAVFLVGFMASGKSTVGPELARRLRWEYVDLDSRVEACEGKSVAEIFRERGEAGFRQAESSALRDLTEAIARDRVVACGGGAFAQENNRILLQDWPTVFLNAPVEELWRRSLEDGIERPLRKDLNQFAQLYAQRLPFYRQATITVETSGREAASICAEIEAELQLTVAAQSAGRGSKSALPDSKSGESQ